MCQVHVSYICVGLGGKDSMGCMTRPQSAQISQSFSFM